MTFQDAVWICLRYKYARFSGRASRLEFWSFALAAVLYTIAVIAVFFGVNFVTGGFAKASGLSSFGLLALMFGGIGYVFLILPAIAVTVRRFHDVNLSGWWVLGGLLLGAVPMIGWIAWIGIPVVALLKGTAVENRSGPNPTIDQQGIVIFSRFSP